MRMTRDDAGWLLKIAQTARSCLPVQVWDAPAAKRKVAIEPARVRNVLAERRHEDGERHASKPERARQQTWSAGTRLDLTSLDLRIGSAAIVAHDRVVWETVDPDGRRVVLSPGRWRHILDEHPELAVPREVILGAVAQPAHRMPGRKP